jgi:hypothetical protein
MERMLEVNGEWSIVNGEHFEATESRRGNEEHGEYPNCDLQLKIISAALFFSVFLRGLVKKISKLDR